MGVSTQAAGHKTLVPDLIKALNELERGFVFLLFLYFRLLVYLFVCFLLVPYNIEGFFAIIFLVGSIFFLILILDFLPEKSNLFTLFFVSVHKF